MLVWDYVFYNLSMAWPGFSFQTAGIDGQRILKKVIGNNNEQINNLWQLLACAAVQFM